MPSNRWVILALLFAVRVSTGIQYQVVASLSPQLMSGFVLTIADIGLLIGLYHAPGMILAFPGGAIGVSHFSFLQDPQQFNNDMLHFLQYVPWR